MQIQTESPVIFLQVFGERYGHNGTVALEIGSVVIFMKGMTSVHMDKSIKRKWSKKWKACLSLVMYFRSSQTTATYIIVYASINSIDYRIILNYHSCS